MNLPRRDLYTLAGLGLIVGAFFAASKAIGGLVALIYFVASTNFTEVDPSLGENIFNTWKASQAAGMIHGVGAFLILFFGGRWMLRGPKLLDRWLEGDERRQKEAGSTAESAKANKPQHPTA